MRTLHLPKFGPAAGLVLIVGLLLGAGALDTPQAGAAMHPTVTGLDPSSGPISGGTSVTISGTRFTGTVQVTFDNVLGTSVTVVNDTTITVTSPEHAAGTVNVVVTATGANDNSAADDFTYVAGVTVTESAGSTEVTEGGATDTYTVVLTAQPLANVTITVSPHPQVTVDDTSLVFSMGNWDTPQTVTVTAVDDGVPEATVMGVIQHAAAGGGYDGVAIAGVTVTITDDDAAGVAIVESGGGTAVTEGGATDTYTVALTSQPASNVTIVVNGTAQASVNPSVLTFTPGNWSSPQTVTVTAVDDGVQEGDHLTTISHTASGGGFDGIAISNVSVSISDNDLVSGAILLVASGGTTVVSEAGGSDTYTVALSLAPSGTVTVTIAAALNQITPSALVLSFTTSNWNVPQTVTVVAVDDAIVEGTHAQAIFHTASGGGYSGVPVASLPLTITDNDVAGVILPSGAAGQVTFTAVADAFVRLDDPQTNFGTGTRIEVDQSPVKEALLRFDVRGVGGRPVERATLRLFVRDSSDEGGLVFGTATATWSESGVTWVNSPPIVLPLIGRLGRVNSGEWVELDVSGLVNGDGVVSIRIAGGSGNDAEYASREDVTRAPELVVDFAASAPPVAAEGGANGSYVVSLASQPSGTITITMSPDTQVSVSPTQLRFTAANWNVPQTVTVVAVDDDLVEGAHSGLIAHSALGPGYTGLAIATVSVEISDNDLPTLAIVETNGDTRVAEGGASDSYTVALGNRPSETVTVQISVEGQVSVSPTTLTFTVVNWQLTQRVTVQAVQDSVVEGEHAGSITHTASGSGFNGAALTTVAVVVTDDDRVETIVLPAGLELVGWFGIPTTSRAIIDSNPLIMSIWVWENAAERWVLDSRLLPDSLRVVIAIRRGQGFFVVALASTTLAVQVVE